MTKLIVAGILFGSFGLAAADAPAGKAHHKPPQEALDACAKSSKDDPCAFKLPDKEIKGTCMVRRHGPGLVCRAPKPAPKAGAGSQT